MHSLVVSTLAMVSMMAMTNGCAQNNADRPIVGAIRWDAWTGGHVTEVVENTLAPREHHFRLPWFAEVVGEDQVKIDGSPQAVMDREIDWAADAGLDYWAFLTYPSGSKLKVMGVALDQYLTSTKRERINFCLILHSTLKGSDERWAAECERTIRLLKEPGYQTVMGGRPLVYAFTGSDFPWERFVRLKAAIAEAGLNPYYVFMGWWPGKNYPQATANGFDAVSNYAIGHDTPMFADLVELTETRYWKRAVESNARYVPLVTSGWDKQPRQHAFVPWEKGAAYRTQKVFPAQPTPGELAAHLRDAITFVNEHPEVCEARAIIIYAWNEYDEGGWIAPTRGADGNPNTERLDAIRTVLKSVNAPPSAPRAED